MSDYKRQVLVLSTQNSKMEWMCNSRYVSFSFFYSLVNVKRTKTNTCWLWHKLIIPTKEHKEYCEISPSVFYLIYKMYRPVANFNHSFGGDPIIKTKIKLIIRIAKGVLTVKATLPRYSFQSGL